MSTGTKTYRADVDDDDVLFIVGDLPPLVHCDTVDAVCVSVRPFKFKMFGGRRKLIFLFEVVEPQQYAGTRLEMFVRWDERWSHLPRSSKLFRVTFIAAGRLVRDARVRPSLFKAKLFKCRVDQVGKSPVCYSVIGTILEKLAG